jgi:hypothetical protein
MLTLGSGVISDPAGCATGEIRRRMSLVQIPTTLLAQVDLRAGGKTNVISPSCRRFDPCWGPKSFPCLAPQPSVLALVQADRFL